MKTVIERSDLLKALNHVQSVVERRNTIPILSNVLLEAEGGHIGEIHVRPGYEFDADFNASADISGTGAEYINAFKLVAELLKKDENFGLDNVEMVWQSQSGAERGLSAIYDEANGADAPNWQRHPS